MGVHTHLSPVLTSQSTVDAQRGKGEGKEGQWPHFAAMRQKWPRRPERTAQHVGTHCLTAWPKSLYNQMEY
jgi:hypothetical protein